MKSLITKIVIAALILVAVGAFTLFRPDQSTAVTPKSFEYPPLHAGIGSPGAVVDPQPENPVFFALVKADWLALGVEEPRTAWEYVQRGMWYQDDMEDEEQAVHDYEHAYEMLEEIAARTNDPTLPERLALIHTRLGPIYLHRGEYERAIHHFEIVLHENPQSEGLNREVALAYEGLAHEAEEHGEDPSHYQELAFEHFEAEYAVNPKNQLTLYEFGHFLTLPEVHIEGVDQEAMARGFFEAYLERAEAHCDTYPLRILEVNKLLEGLGGTTNQAAVTNCVDRERVF